ncbi:surface glycoprotein [Halorientalis persicus]|uniref:Surface glycoprotein n=1 Tax=Halorientalis persicus TaxID=1367881 RepID=A0A1H8TG19_9EURY|nr:BGTF surface domain-containing protein [Halorientalis persicus]SEO89811.1 surface glycoprotein [Halorientalis persicus]
MTGTHDKIRSLFLATLMVTSVFAGFIAFSGAAAGAANSASYSGVTTYSGTDTVSIPEDGSATVSIDTATNSDDIIAVASKDTSYSSNDVESGTSSGAGTVSLDFTGAAPGAYNVYLGAASSGSPDLSDGDSLSDWADVELSTLSHGQGVIASQSDDDPTERQSNRFDARLASGDTYWQGQRLVIKKPDLADQQLDIRETESADGGGERIPSGSLVREVSLDSNGEAVINTENLEGTYAITNGQGNNAVLNFNDGVAGPKDFADDDGANNGEFDDNGEVDTDYVNNGDSDTINDVVQAASFAVTSQNVNIGFQSDESAQDEIYLEADSARTGYNLLVEADGLDDDEIVNVFDDEFEDGDSDNSLGDVFDASEGSADDGDFGADLSSDSYDDGVVFENVNSDANITANFSTVDIGDYEFSFEVTDTGVSDTSSVSVTEEDDVNAEILRGGVATAAQGDFAVIPIQLEETDEAKVNVGFNDVNFNASFRVEDGNDDGVVTVEMNTFIAGREDGDLPGYVINEIGTDWTDDDDSRTVSESNDIANETLDLALSASDNEDSVTTTSGSDDISTDELGMVARKADDLGASPPTAGVGIEGPMEPDQYDVNVTYQGNELDVGTVQVVEPQVSDIKSWTMPGDVFSDVEEDETAEIYEYVNAGELTQTNNVAEEDVLVYQIQSTSMFGALKFVEEGTNDYAKALNKIASYDNTDSFKFSVEQTEDTTSANQQEKELVLSNSNNNGIKVVPDERNSSLFVVMKEDNLQLVREDLEDTVAGGTFGGEANLGMDDGESYVANWTTFEDSDIGDDTQTVTDRASITEKSIEFDVDAGDVIRVAAAEGQTVSGSTSVAPGTELNLRLRSTGDTPFLEDPEAIVSENRTFSTTVDLSDRA